MNQMLLSTYIIWLWQRELDTHIIFSHFYHNHGEKSHVLKEFALRNIEETF